MPFQNGNPGRPKGSKGILNVRVETTAHRLGVDPFEVLCLFAKGDWKALGYKEQSKISFTNAGIEFEEDIITPDHRLAAAKEAAKYLYSQRRSVEHTQNDALKDMSAPQRLEAMKHAVAMLELQMKKENNGS